MHLFKTQQTQQAILRIAKQKYRILVLVVEHIEYTADSQKTKQNVIRGHIGEPPWNGQLQI